MPFWKLYFVSSYLAIICEFSQPPLPSVAVWSLTVNMICLRLLNWCCGCDGGLLINQELLLISQLLIVSLFLLNENKTKFDFGKPRTHHIYDIYGLILVPCRHKKQLLRERVLAESARWPFDDAEVLSGIKGHKILVDLHKPSTTLVDQSP